jgi:hypothetical protein
LNINAEKNYGKKAMNIKNNTHIIASIIFIVMSFFPFIMRATENQPFNREEVAQIANVEIAGWFQYHALIPRLDALVRNILELQRNIESNNHPNAEQIQALQETFTDLQTTAQETNTQLLALRELTAPLEETNTALRRIVRNLDAEYPDGVDHTNEPVAVALGRHLQRAYLHAINMRDAVDQRYTDAQATLRRDIINYCNVATTIVITAIGELFELTTPHKTIGFTIFYWLIVEKLLRKAPIKNKNLRSYLAMKIREALGAACAHSIAGPHGLRLPYLRPINGLCIVAAYMAVDGFEWIYVSACKAILKKIKSMLTQHSLTTHPLAQPTFDFNGKLNPANKPLTLAARQLLGNIIGNPPREESDNEHEPAEYSTSDYVKSGVRWGLKTMLAIFIAQQLSREYAIAMAAPAQAAPAVPPADPAVAVVEPDMEDDIVIDAEVAAIDAAVDAAQGAPAADGDLEIADGAFDRDLRAAAAELRAHTHT